MSDQDPTINARMARYMAAQKKRGQTQIKVWCPKSEAPALKEIATCIREGDFKREERKNGSVVYTFYRNAS